MTFNLKPTAILCAKNNDGDFISIDGITTGETTPDNAAAQINKILGCVGKSVTTANMSIILTKEAVNNG